MEQHGICVGALSMESEYRGWCRGRLRGRQHFYLICRVVDVASWEIATSEVRGWQVPVVLVMMGDRRGTRIEQSLEEVSELSSAGEGLSETFSAGLGVEGYRRWSRLFFIHNLTARHPSSVPACKLK